MAWSDYNDDGGMDIFMNRGALGGTLRTLPRGCGAGHPGPIVRHARRGPPYRNVAAEVGIDKRGCSGRKVNWVDFNRDGLLDLFVNCQDRGNVEPRASIRSSSTGRTPDKHFVDVAAEVGLDMPDHEVIDFVWFDADNDGYVDLLTSEDTGFYLYRNHGGKSFSARVHRPREIRARGQSQAEGNHRRVLVRRWKAGRRRLSGQRKSRRVFGVEDRQRAAAQRRQRTVFDRRSGDDRTAGESATASWVDFDNDGLVDLYAVPQGLFRQRRDHTFEATGLLALPPRKYMAAIANWADFDNDGRRDLLLACIENFSLVAVVGKAAEGFRRQIHVEPGRLPQRGRQRQSLAAAETRREAGESAGDRRAGRPCETADGQQTQQVGLNDGAFFSQGHYRLYFGLGPMHGRIGMTIRWPDGQVQELKDVEGDRLQVIKQAASATREAAK